LLQRLPPVARRGLTVRVVGPGAAMLERLDDVSASRAPTAVLITGLSGACGPDLRTGDVVVGDRVVTPNGPRDGDGGDPGLRGRAVRALDAAGLRYRVGPLLTVDEVVSTPAAKAARWREEGALAVDMESAHVVAWARRAGLPAVTVRAIADSLQDEVPRDLMAIVGADGRTRPWAAVGLLGRPALLGAAWRLGRRSHRALDSLAGFLRAFLDSSSGP
jgi:adenosylhomocysteine nucleosidase